MAQQIQELIDKIKQEGIEAAQANALAIEAQAKQQAQSIVEQARTQAAELLQKAHSDCKKMEESTRTAIGQAGRDILLELRKEILRTLNIIISANVKSSLTPETLAGILAAIIKNFLDKKSQNYDIRVILNPADLEKVKSGLLAQLQEALKKSVKIQAGSEMSAGFTISFDAGKSSFDFTDASLAEYLSGYLNAEIASILLAFSKSKT